MATRHENLIAQVDGVNQVFTTTVPYVSGTLTLVYNGQTFPPSGNVATELTPTTFEVTFPIPADTHSFSVLFEDTTLDVLIGSGLPPIP